MPQLGRLETTFEEPFLSQFIALITAGAGSQDIHDAPECIGYAQASDRDSRLVRNEIERAECHSRNICRYIPDMSPRRILDVGCGTGALSVALALAFPAAQVEAFDTDPSSIEAGRIRIAGYGLSDRVNLRTVPAHQPFPFTGGSFDLVACTSVIEFITQGNNRKQFLAEMQRVVCAGGRIVITTPNAFYPRELHTGRPFQNWLRRPGYPWASTRSWIHRQLDCCDVHSQPARVVDKFQRRYGRPIPAAIARCIEPLMPWQFIVARRRADHHALQ
ncbi:MAG: class I SAM-dependent methyltransferase [Acidobacteriaceae bacterium]|nr:class I SAM-dependent methyltransferase [Acidobacteriaceae bacterium]